MRSGSDRYAVPRRDLCRQWAGSPARGQQVKLVERPPDPHGSPRPARDARDVPLRTSLYFELAMPPEAKGRRGEPRSVAVRFNRRGARPSSCSGRAGTSPRAARDGCGRSRTSRRQVARRLHRAGRPLEARDPLHGARRRPAPRGRAWATPDAGTWSFTTEAAPSVHAAGVPARPGGRAGPVARPVLLGHLQRHLLHPGRRTTGRPTS